LSRDDASLLKYLAKHGSCASGTVDSELFFEADADVKQNQIQTVLPMLRKFCGTCPVQSDCLDYAMRHDVQGIWGGTTHSDRKKRRKILGLKPEPVGWARHAARIRTYEHEVALHEFIQNNPVCVRGHNLKTADDFLIIYSETREDGEPSFRCRLCNRHNSMKQYSARKLGQLNEAI
jgi:hypothetical protein